ncbi:Tyrosine-protein phosphatase 1 [Colletotrichum chlorophyti]|uniref:protein-tyrosine-phosphatase n=1 Tax=Colletotrichum chlorophyti TaxID=708187 RepID=A0A1Q8RQP5_9PEZI|nr:Tyrosine-protein phosphatase 1 [Colletotrichum chlorophyti]
MLDKRSNDGATSVHYTMKTPHSAPRPSPGPRSSHSHSHSQSKLAVPTTKSPKPSTPAASPRMPYSVGQPMPPQKLSPARQYEARAASPNYFGLVVEQSVDPRDSSAMPRDNWSSPTSSVKSFGAALPKQIPIDANPDYEAFKRQADLNRGKGFSLSSSHFPYAPPNPTTLRPRPPRWNTHASDTGSDFSIPRQTIEKPNNGKEVDQESHDSAYVSSESKRNSEASIQPPSILNLNMPRFESPRQTESPFERRTTLSRVDDRHPRLSISQNKIDPPAPFQAKSNHPRAETLPPTMETGPSLITPLQLKQLIEAENSETDLLLLDLRVSQQYAQARIEGALNLCIPTTLLKRATFNLTKLQQTFQNADNEGRFAKWKSTKHLVVYDAYSAEKRDAVSCMNMIKKFSNEGYTGSTYILRGGFNAFAEACPEFVEKGPTPEVAGASSSSPNDGGNRPGVAPVIGGVMLPMASNNPNPFFSNIRQNMDLADGVGQLEIARPSGLESPTLPRWLRDASKPVDHGKQVSEKFLNIEREEQSRMKAAYSMFGGNQKDKNAPQLCGIEKGGKNRYKDILPFEHARVKLQGRPEGACDYVNASHIKSSRSNKRYIATQGPLPATFEDFWSVIWEQDVRVIVMLTAESEGGQLKCHPYWQGRDFGSIKLKLLSEKKVSLDIDKHRSNQGSAAPSAAAAEAGRRRANTTTTLNSSNNTASPLPPQGETPHVIIRKFALSHTSHPFAPMREITHLHYPSWPDFGAPAQPSHLLALVDLANVMQRAALPVDTSSLSTSRASPEPAIAWYDEPEQDQRARPMLVHCSAGCGRTGTFCTVDTVIDMLKRQRLAKLNLKPVRKRDSDGDIKMSGQAEDASPREKTFDFNANSRRSSGEVRRGSPVRSPLDTSWLADDSDTMDLIQKTVDDFRHQRLSMVQSLRQYVLCYETIVEYVWRVHEKNSSSVKGGRARSGSLQLRGDN